MDILCCRDMCWVWLPPLDISYLRRQWLDAPGSQSESESAEMAVAAQLTRFTSWWQLQLAGVCDYVMPPVWWRDHDAVALIMGLDPALDENKMAKNVLFYTIYGQLTGMG